MGQSVVFVPADALPALRTFLGKEGIDHVVMPTGFESRGLAEPAVATLKVDDLVQFERIGFARIDHVSRAEVRAYFAHR